ncbi:Zinc finger protein zfat [Plakobranchus ocellatus]|uniref:Zinc finger protein zfat n=1 Tax=Plakobranchus ocellatus TaxID=259542 RepID=A0AAV4BP79_9GAST|nr:Zinc finger protein zfat [Plakobranchus ocellatus]
MPLDTFICGNCQETFTDLTDFVSHKQRLCSTEGPSASAPTSSSSSQETELIQLHVNESGEITGMTAQGLDEEENKGQDGSALAFLNSLDVSGELANAAIPGKDGSNGGTTHLIILNSPLGGEGENGDGSITLLNNVNLEGLADSPLVLPGAPNVTSADTASDQNQAGENHGDLNQQPKKRRGRAKAGENRPKPLEAVPPSAPRPTAPETDSDGKLVCPQCKRSFAKERHFNTHKCLASSSYVDITKKEMKLDSGDEGGDDLGQDSSAHDDDEDFKATQEGNLEKEEQEDDKEMDREEDEFGNRKRRRGKKRKRSSYQFEVDVLVENEAAKQIKMAAESMENLPIFKNEEEKTQFEACIDVDLSQVDHMFRIHIIEQELNEMSGMIYNTPTMSSLSVYSCNVCDKVFKSLSHIRLHCVTHTDIKPFKCTKCSYSTNSKGNLYTHMRKHTGQYYRCDQCDFKTVNKSHLVEHQMIHTNRRAQCLLCQKDYSTLKSLINHVRKYHTDKKGKDYLQTFLQGRGAKGTTVIHQCHVCNRKFKKRIDRDRHLFIHDIKDLPNVQQCELCDYWASRRVYLDKHYLKHRVIYCCCLCDDKFLSTVKLTKHLTEDHCDQADQSDPGRLDRLLSECINRSLYLPEPLVTSQEGSKYVNLPPELREAVIPEEPKKSDKAEVSADASTAETETAAAASEVISEDPASQEDQRLASDSDPNVASALVSSSPPPGQSDGDCKSVGNQPSFGESEEKECAVTVPPSDSGDMNNQGANTPSEGIEVSGCDLSTSVKLSLEALGEPSQGEECGLGLEAGKVEKMDLMMMLQNPGSDSDQEVDGQISDTEEGKADLGEGEESEATAAGIEKADSKEGRDPGGEIHQEPDKGEAEETRSEEGKEKESAAVPHAPDETGTTVVVEESKEKKIQALVERLGYRKMTTEIFQKMRETFGHEECEYCGRLFYNKMEYEPHLRTHTGDKPFACSNCSFRGNTKEQLRKHSEREHEKVAFQCKECDFLAPTRTRLWNHQLKHLGINGLSCPECPSKFDGMKQLRAHILNSHKDMDKDALEKLTGYRHKTLGKMGRRSFKCPHCPRVFIRANSELQKHIWIHEGIKPYTCPICPYACRSKNNLQAHMLRHSAEKPFSCSECGKEYKSKTALRWHVRSHKTGKPFKCDKCSYEATQASHLKRHMETHEVLKRFICKHCDYSANTLGYMKIHYAKHHKGQAFSHEEIVDPESSMTDKRVYKCLSCGYLFGNLSDLKRHLKIRHHVLMQDIADMEQMHVSEVEVMQYEEASPAVGATAEIASSQQNQPQAQLTQPVGGEIQLQMPGGEGVQAFTAASLIQHIMGLSQLGNGQVRVMSEDGQPLEFAPETIVVRQDGQLLLSGDGNAILPGNQFVIQYYNPDEVNESTTSSAQTSLNAEVQIVAGEQHNLQQQNQQQPQPLPHQQQLLMGSHGQIQPVTSTQYIINTADGASTQGPAQPVTNTQYIINTADGVSTQGPVQPVTNTQYIINTADTSSTQGQIKTLSSTQYIVNTVDGSTTQVTSQEGVDSTGQAMTIDSHGIIVPTSSAPAGIEVKFVPSANARDQGGGDHSNSVPISVKGDQKEDFRSAGESGQVIQMQVTEVSSEAVG